jgi:hypothetical protein
MKVMTIMTVNYKILQRKQGQALKIYTTEMLVRMTAWDLT